LIETIVAPRATLATSCLLEELLQY